MKKLILFSLLTCALVLNAMEQMDKSAYLETKATTNFTKSDFLSDNIKSVLYSMDVDQQEYVKAVVKPSYGMRATYEISPDNNYLVTIMGNNWEVGPFTILNLKTNAEKNLHLSSMPQILSISPDSNHILIVEDFPKKGSKVTIWDLKAGTLKSTLETEYKIHSAFFYATNSVELHSHKVSAIWYFENNKEVVLDERKEPGVILEGVTFDDNHRCYKFWDPTLEEYYVATQALTLRCKNLKISPDGKYIVKLNDWGLILGELSIYETESKKMLWSLRLTQNESLSCWIISPDSNYIVTETFFRPEQKQVVRLWDIKTGEQLKFYKEIPYIFRSVSFSPNNDLIICSGNTAEVVDLKTGNTKYSFSGSDNISSLTFSANNKYAIVSSSSGGGFGIITRQKIILDWEKWYSDITNEINNLTSLQYLSLLEIDKSIKQETTTIPKSTLDILPPLIKTKIEKYIELLKQKHEQNVVSTAKPEQELEPEIDLSSLSPEAEKNGNKEKVEAELSHSTKPTKFSETSQSTIL